MAFGDGSIGTQTGIGQGLAYVLPKSRTEDYAFQLAQDDSKRLAAAAAAQLKRGQAQEDAIAKQFAAQKLPALWSPYNKAVADASSSWQQKAATYNAATGKSPFTNPELMNEYNTNVVGLGAKSKDFGDRVTKQYSAALNDAGNKYTPESVKAVIDNYDTILKNPMEALNKPLPELKVKSSTFNDLTKELKPQPLENNDGSLKTVGPNREANIDQARTTVLNNPERWAPMLQKEFNVDITKPTFPLLSANGRNIYPTNDKAVEVIADKILATPTGLEQVVEFGIDPADPFAKERFMDVIKKQNGGFGKYLKEAADNADAKVRRSTERVYNSERMNIAAERLNMARERAEAGGGGDQAVLERQQWIEDLTKNVANSGERLNGIMMGRGYDGPLKIEKTKDGSKITYVIPPKTDTTTSTTETTDDGETVEKEKTTKKVIPGRRVTIDVNEAGYRHKLNEVLNELTGENIKVSKYTTGEPSGKIKGERISSAPAQGKTQAKTVPLSTVKSKVGKPGYEGYTEKELVDYYKSQGYTIK